MTCAVAFFGCSCSLTDDSESSKPKRSSIIEKSVTTPSAQDVENDKDYADVKTDYAYETLTDDYVKELLKIRLICITNYCFPIRRR